MPFDTAKLQSFPVDPGVYIMKDKDGNVLYVGKAKSIKNRLKQYFSGRDLRPQLPHLLERVTDIEFIIVSSEKESLLLENTLIKKLQPKYNILLKDDKGYLSIKLSTKHPFPMMQLMRFKGPTPKDGTYFGPYTSADAARKAFDLISKSFPLRQCSDEEFARRTKPCILYQMKRCPAPCVGFCSVEDYAKNVDKAKALLQGKDKQVIAQLKKQMEEESLNLNFESAAETLKKIRTLETVCEEQKVAGMKVDDADVIAIVRKEGYFVITTLFYRSSRLVGSHSFVGDDTIQDDDELFQSYLIQHYMSEHLPHMIIISSSIDLANEVEEILKEAKGWKGHIIQAAQGEKRKMVELACANAEAYLGERLRRQKRHEKLLLDIKDLLGLRHYPKLIECYDNSHLAGSEKVACMVSFIEGQKFTRGYRKWRIRSVEKGDDIAMMKEAITRRFHSENRPAELPNLIVIDGGKGHLNACADLLSSLGIVSCDVIAFAKEQGRHDKGLSAEKIYIADSKEPILLPIHSPLLQFFQKIRDEAHRFAITFQRERRVKGMRASELDGVVGIGPIKKKKLLLKFGSVRSIALASDEELLQVPGITAKELGAIRMSLSLGHIKEKD